MYRETLPLSWSVLLALGSTAIGQVSPPGVSTIDKIFEGDVRVTAGTTLVLQQELAGESAIIQNGLVGRPFKLEQSYIQVHMKNLKAKRLARGAELLVTEINVYRSAFDSGEFIINLEVKLPGGTFGNVILGMPERAGSYMTADGFKKTMGDTLRVKSASR